MMKSICPLCGNELPIDVTQIAICTKEKGIEAVCLSHEFSQEIKDYIAAHGGPDDIRRRLIEREIIEPYNGGPGYLAMPLFNNVPNPDPAKGWMLTQCPVCGADCWRTPEHETLEKSFPLKSVCTNCALRLGSG